MVKSSVKTGTPLSVPRPPFNKMCSSFILHVAVLSVALAAGRSSVGDQLHLETSDGPSLRRRPSFTSKQEEETGCGDGVSADARGSIKPSII